MARVILLSWCYILCLSFNAASQGRLITIENAIYQSAEGDTEDVTSRLSWICNGRSRCAFRVIWSAIGMTRDIPGTNKQINVSYKCGGELMPEYREHEILAASFGC
jgi:hypothetical protein